MKSLWWIPKESTEHLKPTDIATLRMARMVTLLVCVALVYFVLLIAGFPQWLAGRASGSSRSDRCGCAEAPAP